MIMVMDSDQDTAKYITDTMFSLQQLSLFFL